MAIAESLKNLQLKFVFRKDAEIGGNKYTLQVLSLKEEQRVQSLPTEGIDGIEFFAEMQKSILSNAIRAVDGEEIPDIIEVDGADGTKVTKERPIYVREVLEGLPPALIENLFQVYGDMRDQKETEINSSLTYSWYKTPEQREAERKAKEDVVEAPKTGDSSVPPTGSVPSPDDPITFKKIPTDYDNDPAVKKA